MKINDITIKVHRFGPLEDVSFKLAPLMIFTGMSSLGKSYANYLVYYFFLMLSGEKLRDFNKDNLNKSREVHQYIFDLDVFLKSLENHAEDFMRKFLGDDELKCNVEFKSLKRKRTLPIEIRLLEVNNMNGEDDDSSSFIHTTQPCEITMNDRQIAFPSIEYAKYYTERYLQGFILGEYISRAVILPPGRGAFVGENFSLKSEVASSMNMYNLYFRDYDYGLISRIRYRSVAENRLSDRLLKLTSGGQLITIEGKQYLQLNKKEKIALSAGASSVKDLSPWLFYMKNHWASACSFCLEEPEAHQHPSVTVQIADVIALAMHQPAACVFHLTTHSDYLIQRLNQLVKLGTIRNKDKNLFMQICKERDLDKRSYLDAKDIQAYYFSKNNKGKTVVEKLRIDDDGIPMKSFFDVVRDLETREDYINAAIYHLNKD